MVKIVPEVVDIKISASPYFIHCRVSYSFINPIELIVFKTGVVSGRSFSEGSLKFLETEIINKTL